MQKQLPKLHISATMMSVPSVINNKQRMFTIVLSLIAVLAPQSVFADTRAPALIHTAEVRLAQPALVQTPPRTRPSRTASQSALPKAVKTATPTSIPAPTPVATPTTVQTTSSYAQQIESLVLQYTSDARRSNGLAPLQADTRLAAMARAHSADMLANAYFQHDSRNGCSPECRLQGIGYSWRAWAENIHWMYGVERTAADAARKIVNDWMNSPSHRANILNGMLTHAGVGIAVSGTTIYSTTDYATPR